MKFLLVVLALVGIASPATFRGARHPQLELLRQRIGKNVVKALLPALPGVIDLNTTKIQLDLSILTVDGELANGQITGLDTLTDKLVLNLLALTVTGDVEIPTLRVTGEYKGTAQARLTEGTFDLAGEGSLDVTLTKVKALGLRVKVNVNLITSRVTIASIAVTPSVSSANIIVSGATANGQPIDWAAVSADIPKGVEENWAANKDAILEDIRLAANELIKDMSLQDLIDLITGGGKY